MKPCSLCPQKYVEIKNGEIERLKAELETLKQDCRPVCGRYAILSAENSRYKEALGEIAVMSQCDVAREKATAALKGEDDAKV